MSIEEMLSRDFGTISDLIHVHAQAAPDRAALVQPPRTLSYAEVDTLMDRVAAALQRDGVAPGEAVAICATTSLEYAVTYLGALRAGVSVAPLAPSSTPEQLVGMAANCDARLLFLDAGVAAILAPVADRISARRIALDGSDAGAAFSTWLADEDAKPHPVTIDPGQAFNIIYSSGTTGTPKGIVQSHAMRWRHMNRLEGLGYGTEAVALISTPLYSNTTLVCFFPALAGGGTVALMPRFDARRYLELAEQLHATHTMLVPVQYRRLLEDPEFDRFDLSAFKSKLCTSAPFSAALKAEVLRRWPGGLTEYYGMTEGGGACILLAHEHPDKLHTVGRPAEDNDIRVIDEAGAELPYGEVGEIVGRSASVMTGYFKQPDKTAEATWIDAEGNRFIRTGDVGRFDAEGFMTLMDRKKDMVISGGFNVYPSDLEAVLLQHPAVAEAAVVGAPSDRWGETPVAFVALKPGAAAEPADIKAFANNQLGKTQRLSDLLILDSLPRSHIGKVLKRELRDGYKPKEGG
ncbi:MAG: class I adenylate-forming enzyme family protein [Caulobacteraceae bacterium]